LDCVRGNRIPFISEPKQNSEPISNISDKDSKLMDECIHNLLATGAIVKSEEEDGQFVSRIFTVSKPDGSRRPIINLPTMRHDFSVELQRRCEMRIGRRPN